jgi:hypothetical protein
MDRHFWIVVDRLKAVLILFGLTIPFVGAGIGAIVGRKHRRGAVSAVIGAGFGMIVCPVALWFGMCTPPVGRGVAAERWYQKTAPVITALDAYYAQHGEYPDSLGSLVPSYLSAGALSATRIDPNGTLSYARDTSGYTLRFEYHGPGVNHCTYGPGVREWSCSGYF